MGPFWTTHGKAAAVLFILGAATFSAGLIFFLRDLGRI